MLVYLYDWFDSRLWMGLEQTRTVVLRGYTAALESYCKIWHADLKFSMDLI